MMLQKSIFALSIAMVFCLNHNAMASEPLSSAINFEQAFEQSAAPMQIAALSKQEMQETKGAVAPQVVGAGLGAAVGVGGYAYTSHKNNIPMTWKGAGYAAGVGAVMGSGTGALVRAAGGGIAGNIAWRPGMMAAGAGAQMGNPAFRPR